MKDDGKLKRVSGLCDLQKLRVLGCETQAERKIKSLSNILNKNRTSCLRTSYLEMMSNIK